MWINNFKIGTFSIEFSFNLDTFDDHDDDNNNNKNNTDKIPGKSTPFGHSSKLFQLFKSLGPSYNCAHFEFNELFVELMRGNIHIFCNVFIF